MIISNYMKDKYQVKIKDKYIDIFDYEEVLELIQKIIKKVININSDNGVFRFDIYLNYDYGMVIDINKIDDSEELEVKIGFHIDSLMLVRVDYFYLKDIGIKEKDIYYYKDNFYIFYDKEIREYSDLIYAEEALEIIDKGIKLRI